MEAVLKLSEGTGSGIVLISVPCSHYRTSFNMGWRTWVLDVFGMKICPNW